jgi:hypothetical protein
MKWFVRADVDGFFGLALDNLVQLLVYRELMSACPGFFRKHDLSAYPARGGRFAVSR